MLSFFHNFSKGSLSGLYKSALNDKGLKWCTTMALLFKDYIHKPMPVITPSEYSVQYLFFKHQTHINKFVYKTFHQFSSFKCLLTFLKEQ